MAQTIRHTFKILLIVLTALAASCQKESQEPLKSITLNLQEGDPPTLHPHLGPDLRSRCLFLNLFEPLMRLNSEGILEPAAADTVSIDDTYTIYTFHIRPHQWSNGKWVTSHHFADAWKFALTPGSPACRTDLFYPIKNSEKVKKGELPIETLGISTPDPETLIVTLEHPTSYFLDLTATSFYAPLYEATPKEPEFFNGPFIVKEWEAESMLKLMPNPYYWDLQAVELQEICFTMVRDPGTALAMYEQGELDLVGDPLSPLPFDVIPSLEIEGNLNTKEISRIFYFLLNTETYPLNNKHLRKALALSIDREELTRHLFFGEIPTITPLPKTLSRLGEKEEHLAEPSALLFFEKALQEIGVDREHFPLITLSYSELSGQKKLAEFVQDQWKEKLGIEIELMCNEWNVHASKLRSGDFQIGTLHLTTLYPDPMFYLDLFRDKTSRSSYCKWENPHFKALLNTIDQTTNPEERHRYLIEAERQLLDEMPAIALFTQNLQYLLKDNLKLEISELGIYDFKNSHLR